MEIGVIGLGGNGRAVVGQLLEKTARNLSVYDPDGRSVRRAVNVCATAAELCDRCDRIVVALDASADLTRLCNSIAPFVRPGQIFIDLTDTSPALAHAAANGMRRLGAAYIDCGVFGREGLDGPFILFAGGRQRGVRRGAGTRHLRGRRAGVCHRLVPRAERGGQARGRPAAVLFPDDAAAPADARRTHRADLPRDDHYPSPRVSQMTAYPSPSTLFLSSR